MKNAVFLALLLLLVAPCASSYHSGAVQLYPSEFRDFGNASLPKFEMTLMMDCNAATISTYVRSGGQPVSGATSNLKYIQYEQPLLSSGMTGATGLVTHKLSGNISYMTGIFVLTVEKSGYQRREAHFYIEGCFEPDAGAPPPEPPVTTPAPPGQNATPPPSGNVTPPPNPTQNATGNQTGNQTGATNPLGKIPCPLSAAVLGLLAVGAAKSRAA